MEGLLKHRVCFVGVLEARMEIEAVGCRGLVVGRVGFEEGSLGVVE